VTAIFSIKLLLHYSTLVVCFSFVTGVFRSTVSKCSASSTSNQTRNHEPPPPTLHQVVLSPKSLEVSFEGPLGPQPGPKPDTGPSKLKTLAGVCEVYEIVDGLRAVAVPHYPHL